MGLNEEGSEEGNVKWETVPAEDAGAADASEKRKVEIGAAISESGENPA